VRAEYIGCPPNVIVGWATAHPAPLGSRAHEGSVTTCLRRGGIVIQEQIYYRVREKNESRLIFGELMGKSLVSCFFCRLP